MRRPKSSSFARRAENSESEPGRRPRARSSLDTFVIPGRTRLPSSKSSQPGSIDIEITRGLLNPSLVLPPKMPPVDHPESRGRRPQTEVRSPTPRSGNGKHELSSQKETPPIRPRPLKHPPPQFRGREVIVVPHRRPRQNVYHPEPQRQVSNPFEDSAHPQAYDGAQDSGPESRVTSVTWSTVSHRIFTDSSGSSRGLGSSQTIDQYNRLAEKHGLPHLPEEKTDDESQTKTTAKPHQGWLARKFFRRSSSAYTLKAKTTYRPAIRKKSFSVIPSMSDDCHTNILKDKSLEDMSRLGGLGIFILPHDFAADKLTLPTCLSATATYLCQHGCNSPGIFRVSGQTSTVNALYEYYDHQFSNAGSPSKVQETVGFGLLPTHIEHTVTDVASLFKKILIGLPGGLLGSLSLFDTLRSIAQTLHRGADQSEEQFTVLKARLIALAISSARSAYRVYLIQAVFGLAAYFGHEAKEAAAQEAATTAQEDPNQQRSELMGYRALGVVLGPLLLGDLTNNILARRESQDEDRPTSSDSVKKSRKQKRHSGPSKLETDSMLIAHVERANLTASVVEMLLLIWRDVVKQLREINGGSSSSHPKSDAQVKKLRSRGGSSFTLRSSEDEMTFLDVLRGRTLPNDFRGVVEMKSKVRVSSRSPISRGIIKVSGGNKGGGIWLPAASEEHVDEDGSPIGFGDPPLRSARLTDEGNRSITEERREPTMEDYAGLEPAQRTKSDIAMEKMAMGTILPRLEDLPISPEHKGVLRRMTPITTPKQSSQRSASQPPETAVKDMPQGKRISSSEATGSYSSTDKPLPPIGDAQRAELSSPLAEDDDAKTSDAVEILYPPPREQTYSPSWEVRTMFPARLSSLPQEKKLPIRPVETYETLEEYKERTNHFVSPRKYPISPKTSEVTSDEDEVPDGVKRHSVKFLAQRFTERSRTSRSEERSKDTAVPKVQAHVHALPSPKDPLVEDPFVENTFVEDPFTFLSGNSTKKETLIPKPVCEAGRGRKAESRSSSPPKRPALRSAPKNRPRVLKIVPDQDAEMVSTNISRRYESPVIGRQATTNPIQIASNEEVGSSTQTPPQNLEVSRIRPLSAYSAESLHRLRAAVGEPPIAHHTPTRAVSVDRSLVSNSYLEASNALGKLERHGSINATLYAEILRLQRLLEQRGEEVQSARRSLDAVRDSKEGSACSRGGETGSPSKGALSEEVREARKELSLWKRRAEQAEQRLQGFAGTAAGK